MHIARQIDAPVDSNGRHRHPQNGNHLVRTIIALALLMFALGLGIGCTIEGVYDGRTLLALAAIVAAFIVHMTDPKAHE